MTRRERRQIMAEELRDRIRERKFSSIFGLGNREGGFFSPTSHILVDINQETQIPWVLLPVVLDSFLNPLLSGPLT